MQQVKKTTTQTKTLYSRDDGGERTALEKGRHAFLQLQHSRDCERFYLPQLLSFFDGCCGGVDLKEFGIQRVESSCSFGLWLVRDQIQISTTDSSSTKRIPVEKRNYFIH